MSGRDRVFISYRRSDRAASAALLRKALVERLGEDVVFQDVQGIPPGATFPEELAKELSRAAVVLAVIGPDWLSASNEFNQRRIDFEDDWVRTELEEALNAESVLVVPVLVDGTALPPAHALPKSLRGLTARNACELHHEMWDESCSRLLDVVAHRIMPGSPRSDVGEAAMLVGSDGSLDVALLREVVRSAVIEALQTAGQIGVPDRREGNEQAHTYDDLSRLLAAHNVDDLNHERQATLELLLRRIVGQSTVLAAEHAESYFAESTELGTKTGRWLVFAVKIERPSRWERVYSGCLLLLPDETGHVSGAAVLSAVEFDAEFAQDDGLEYIRHGRPAVEIGERFGEVFSS